MPIDPQRIVRRGGTFAPLVSGPEDELPLGPVVVQLAFPAQLLRGQAAWAFRILDEAVQADFGWRQFVEVYGSPAPPPRGQASWGYRIVDHAETAKRPGLVVYGSPAPPPQGWADWAYRILDEPAQPDPGWREWLMAVGPPAPPPPGVALRGRVLLDESPGPGWLTQSVIQAGSVSANGRIAYGSPARPPQGWAEWAAVVLDTPQPALIEVLAPTVVYGTPARPLAGVVIRTDWSRDGSSAPVVVVSFGPQRAVYADIVARLAALGCFADGAVARGAPSEVLMRSGRQSPCAAVQALTWVDGDRYDEGDFIRTCSFTITLIVRMEEPDQRQDWLDYLSDRVSNALNGESLAGITFGPLTLIQRGQYAAMPQHPEQRAVLTGQFVYEVVGYGARDESEPT